MGVETRPLCSGVQNVTRAARFSSLSAAALSGWLGPSQITDVSTLPTDKKLVVLFLRGAMDGVSLLVPYGDDDYHRHRPTIGLGTVKSGVIDLDGFFGFHPAAAKLSRWYQEGKLAGIHAIGSMDQSRSHFEAMATMERGAKGDPQTLSSGWLARALAATSRPNVSPLRSVAFGNTLADTLRGDTIPSLIRSVNDLKLGGSKALRDVLRTQYTQGHTAVHASGMATLRLLDAMDKLDPNAYTPAFGASYPTSLTGESLRQTSLLIKANVGVNAVFLDSTGWDSHVTQGTSTGYLAGLFLDLSESLNAFATDLGPHLESTTVLVMTEFGRRIPENSALGTDHGRASAWLAIGAGVCGGKVHTKWPGLKAEQMEEPGDLRVTTDYRDVLSEACHFVFGTQLPSNTIFPGHQYRLSGAFASTAP